MLIILGFLFMIIIFVASGILTQMLTFFLDLPSILLIVVPLLFFLISSKSGSNIGKYIVTSFKRNHTYTKTELVGLSISIKNTIRFLLSVGGFGFLFGLIASLAHIGSLDRFGPNLAISLLTLTYSITISFFIFFPLQAWSENKLNSTGEH